MSDSTGRYATVGTRTLRTADGRRIRYFKRRFLPNGRRQTLLHELTVTEGERLDLIAARTFGDPTAFWRIADANNAMDPEALTDEPGRRIRITVPTHDEPGSDDE